MKKKFLGLLLSVAMVATFVTGCGGGSDSSSTSADTTQTDDTTDAADDTTDAADDTTDAATDETTDAADAEEPSSDGDLIKVAVINNDPSESGYRTANDADLRATFTEENGYEATFFNSLKNEEQIKQAQQFIQEDIDYLLLSAADTAGWDTVLQDAQTNGIQVILFDRIIDADESLYAAAIVSDMEKEGTTAVDWLESQGLSEYNIIHIQGVMGSAAQKGRTKALDDRAAEKGWNIVVQQAADWDEATATEIVNTAITAGQKFNVIYAENDNMARGAVTALDNAGITHGVDGDVIIMGFDTNKFALEELKAGNWNYDGQCNPFQSSYIVDVINTLEKGEEPAEKTIIMDEKGFDAATITDADIDQYGI